MCTVILRSLCLVILLLTSSAYALVLPQRSAQNEIKWQLLELAVANVDVRFAKQFDKIVRASESKNHTLYASELKKGYFLIKHFRNYFDVLPWEQKQYLTVKLPKLIVSGASSVTYDHMALNNSLLADLISFRPNVPYYLKYRDYIKHYLTTKDLNLPKYRFKVISKKSSGESVNQLKRALKKLGFLDINCPEDGMYDLELNDAVKALQSANSLKADGIVGFRTYTAIYRTNREKAVALARSILRLNDSRLKTMSPYVLVNLPEAMLHVYSEGSSIIDSKVVIGKVKAQTPLLHSIINNVVLNPSWNVPKSIKKEYLMHLRQDPLYLQKKGIDIVDHNLNIIDPLSLSEEELTFRNFKYLMRQLPGKHNALGLYKFNFPNTEDVYLHSTSQPYLFKRDSRALSSGCVRVEKAAELAHFLLQGTRYTPKVVDRILAQGDTKWATLENKTPVFIAYWTAYIGQNSQVYFHDDVYKLDAKYKVLPKEVVAHFKQY